MKSLIQVVVIGAALSAPIVSFAQSSAPLTRAEVKAEVVELEKSGYPPTSANDFNYPQVSQAVVSIALSGDRAPSGDGAITRVNSRRSIDSCLVPPNQYSSAGA
ncbi:DUF4148 domain-containing protein [Burkholderia diffusa]|uniref:DUF4148 domain-containing protein n=1 Tax=Burkholderia diffusa TaxID=488732 RepID=UPI0009BCDAC5|nr:DUF4148 domain-containing protein [Burkholderia diffusa]